ncbi:MAG: branched-chain amino acid ABC transporter permease [Candidatus Dormibacteria bacterium]
MLLEYAIMAGVLFGVFYAYLAIGLNLIFAVLRVVNLAHGDLVMLGSYLAFELYYAWHWNPLLAILVAIIPAILLGGAIYLGVAPRLARASDPEMMSLVLFFGISQIIEALATFGFGSNQRSITSTAFSPHPVSLLGQGYPITWVVAAVTSVPVLLILFAYLSRTKLGRATRAVMASPDEAAAVGINVRRISGLTFGIGVALAVGAGSLAIFMLGGVNPTEGVSITVISFAVIVIGGLGNTIGTVVGGLVFGLASQITLTFQPNWAALVPYVLLLAVVLIRPSGILSRTRRLA